MGRGRTKHGAQTTPALKPLGGTHFYHCPLGLVGAFLVAETEDDTEDDEQEHWNPNPEADSKSQIITGGV